MLIPTSPSIVIHRAFFQNIGFSELIVILVIVLVLFGGTKLPKLMTGLGEGIRNFKDAMKGEPPADKDKPKEETSKEKENSSAKPN